MRWYTIFLSEDPKSMRPSLNAPLGQEDELFKKSQKVIGRVLKGYFPEITRNYSLDLDELLINIKVALSEGENRLKSDQIWSAMEALSRFEELHTEALRELKTM